MAVVEAELTGRTRDRGELTTRATPQPQTRSAISLIVAVDSIHPGLDRSIRAMQKAVSAEEFEVIVASRDAWPQAPDGVRVVAYDSASRGDRLDRASEAAGGDILAFVDDRVRLEPGWAKSIRRVFDDPEVTVAGGPILPRHHGRGERVASAILTRRVVSTPGTHIAHAEKPRTVRELAGSNLIVRTSAWRSIGGFQSPSPGGEAVRLCHKLRLLRGDKIHYRPELAVRQTVRPFPGRFLSDVLTYGRARGDLARRLPEAAPLVPYGLPTLVLVVLVAHLALIPLHLFAVAKIGLLVLTAAFLAEGLSVMLGRGRFTDRVLAAFALPVVTLAYGAGFLRGFLGPDLGEISPPRLREQPMRVLIFNWRDVAHPWAGGAEAYLHEIGRGMVARGMEVGWVSQRYSGAKRVEVIDGIRIHRVGGKLTLYPFAAVSYMLRLRKRYDVVVDGSNGIPFFTPLFCRRPKVMLVHHVHQEVFRRELPRYSRWLALWLEGWLVPRVYRRTPVVAVSNSTRDGLTAIGFRRDQIAIVHNGVATPRPSVVSTRSAVPTILCMGRLKPQKSIDVLLRAMPAVLKAAPEARLDIVGQGSDRTRLERLAWSLGLAHQVRFHGYLPSRARDDLAARAWVAVCPSAFEGWGLVCVEASARGLPVVAADVPGLRDAVRHGITGLLVPHGDSDALAQSLLDLFANPEARLRMGDAGQEWAAQHSWERSTAEFVAQLTKLTPAHRTASVADGLEAHGDLQYEELSTEHAV
jgi:glycosyltransferase involved in cell wall biosynthesis